MVRVSSCVDPKIINIRLSNVKLLQVTLTPSILYTFIKWRRLNNSKLIRPITDTSSSENSIRLGSNRFDSVNLQNWVEYRINHCEVFAFLNFNKNENFENVSIKHSRFNSTKKVFYMVGMELSDVKIFTLLIFNRMSLRVAPCTIGKNM